MRYFKYFFEVYGYNIEMVLSPRTVIAFIRYFSRDVIGKMYNVKVLSEMEDALFVLTEQLIYRLDDLLALTGTYL